MVGQTITSFNRNLLVIDKYNMNKSGKNRIFYTLKCLDCGHEYDARKDMVMSTSKNKNCPKCHNGNKIKRGERVDQYAFCMSDEIAKESGIYIIYDSKRCYVGSTHSLSFKRRYQAHMCDYTKHKNEQAPVTNATSLENDAKFDWLCVLNNLSKQETEDIEKQFISWFKDNKTITNEKDVYDMLPPDLDWLEREGHVINRKLLSDLMMLDKDIIHTY